MSNRVQHVTIVGGGTAGWLAAGILHAGLNRRGDGPDVHITVIESPNIPTIGVGEATTVSMGQTLKQLGVDERDFLKQCNG
ncbi:MAG: tryptophan 7-halogenase, partial [Alphaproteobacteria bacterium]